MSKDKAAKEEKAPKAELTPEEAAAASKKKKMLMFIIGGVVATTAIGGGLALVLTGGKDPKSGEESGEAGGHEVKHGEKKGEGKDAKHGEKKEEEKEDKLGDKKGEGKDAKHGEKKEEEKDAKHDEKKGEKHGEKTVAKSDNKVGKIDGVDFGCTMPLQAFHLNLGNPLENRYIRLEVTIEYNCSEEIKAEMDKRLPQLRDAVIHVTTRKTREFLLGPDGKEQLRKEIENRINQYMTKKIDNIFITDILIE